VSVHWYLLAPLSACLISAVCAAVILDRDSHHRANRLVAFIVLGCTFWSLCEVLWNTTSDPEVSLALVRLSAFGWIWIGPAFLHLMISATSSPAPRARRLLRFLYPLMAVMLFIAWTTPLVTASVVRTSWGVAYRTGPLMGIYYAITVSTVLVALVVGRQAFLRSRSDSEREQARLLIFGISVPLVAASVTDAILPMMGVQWPRVGTLSLAVLCAVITSSRVRYGYSVLAPGRFQREVFDALQDGIAILHLDGSLRTGNPAIARLLGCSLDGLEGTSLSDRLGVSRDELTSLHDRQLEVTTASGERVLVAVSGSTLRDKRGSPVAILLLARDLREVSALQRRLATQDRLAAVGQLAAGIAHEVNNPLAYASTNLHLLRRDWGKVAEELREQAGPEARAFLGEAEEAFDEALEGVNRAIAIVRDVTRFARGGDEGRVVSCDLRSLLEHALRFARPQIARGVRVEEDYAELPPVPGAPRELEQVFLNLILNAAQALGSSGRIGLRTLTDGAFAVVVVEDDGPGIPADQMDRIFDPFFTTKAVGEGTGLGLAVSHEIVRRHGGEIRVVSRPGAGTRFEARLPLPGAEE
jgi:PAS domain S-box-containing protein